MSRTCIFNNGFFPVKIIMKQKCLYKKVLNWQLSVIVKYICRFILLSLLLFKVSIYLQNEMVKIDIETFFQGWI